MEMMLGRYVNETRPVLWKNGNEAKVMGRMRLGQGTLCYLCMSLDLGSCEVLKHLGELGEIDMDELGL